MRKSLSAVFVAALGVIGSVSPAMAACGQASFYGTWRDGYAWKRTSSGEVMDPRNLTTAHPYLPFGTRLVVRNQFNGREVAVRVNDRGPFYGGRVLDLSPAAFSEIASRGSGHVRVCYSRL